MPPSSSPSLRRRWLAMPPLRPASRASSLVHSWAVPFWCAALPPLLAISRCLARSIDAKPRSSLATVDPPPVPSPGFPALACGQIARAGEPIKCNGSATNGREVFDPVGDSGLEPDEEIVRNVCPVRVLMCREPGTAEVDDRFQVHAAAQFENRTAHLADPRQ